MVFPPLVRYCLLDLSISNNSKKKQAHLIYELLYINSIYRSSIALDTTLSIIYGLQAAATADQQLYLNANVHVSDSLYLPEIKNAYGFEQWLGQSVTGAVFGDSLTDASEGLTDPLIDFEEWLKDTKKVKGKDEIGWVTPKGKIEHSIKGRPSKTIYKLQYMVEMLMRNNAELQKRVEALEKIQDNKPVQSKFVRTKRRK